MFKLLKYRYFVAIFAVVLVCCFLVAINDVIHSDESVVHRIFEKQSNDNIPPQPMIPRTYVSNELEMDPQLSSKDRWSALKKELSKDKSTEQTFDKMKSDKSAQGTAFGKWKQETDKKPNAKKPGYGVERKRSDIMPDTAGKLGKESNIKGPKLNDNLLVKKVEFIKKPKGELRKCTNYERRIYIEKQCEAITESAKTTKWKASSNPTFVLQPELQLSLCAVPKNAKTAWKRILSASTKYGQKHGPLKQVNFLDLLHQWGLDIVDYKKAKQLNYTNIIILRHPFERLASAYVDRLAFNNGAILKKYVQEHFRTGAASNDAIYNASLTFVEYLRMVIAGNEYLGSVFGQPYSAMCQVCSMAYGKIMRTETMAADARQFMAMMKVKIDMVDDYQHGHSIDQSIEPDFTKALEETAYQKHHMKLFDTVPAVMIDKLMQIFKDDFTLFGYKFDVDNKEASCEMQSLTGESCC